MVGALVTLVLILGQVEAQKVYADFTSFCVATYSQDEWSERTGTVTAKQRQRRCLAEMPHCSIPPARPYVCSVAGYRGNSNWVCWFECPADKNGNIIWPTWKYGQVQR
jgi:hypothetical protein